MNIRPVIHFAIRLGFSFLFYLLFNQILSFIFFPILVFLNVIIVNSIEDFDYKIIKNRIIFLRDENVYLDINTRTYYGKLIAKDFVVQMNELGFYYKQIVKPINFLEMYFTDFGVVIRENDKLNLKKKYYVNNNMIRKIPDESRHLLEMLLIPINKKSTNIAIFLRDYIRTLIPTKITVNELVNYLMMSKAVKKVMSVEQLLEEYYIMRTKPPLQYNASNSNKILIQNLQSIFYYLAIKNPSDVLKELGLMRGRINYDRDEIRKYIYDTPIDLVSPLPIRRTRINVLKCLLLFLFTMMPTIIQNTIFISTILTGKLDFLFKVLCEDWFN